MVQTAQIGRKLAHKRVRRNSENAAVKPLLTDAPTQARPMTGAQIVAYWEQEGLGGVYSDPVRFPQDSPDLARLLRKQAETRE